MMTGFKLRPESKELLRANVTVDGQGESWAFMHTGGTVSARLASVLAAYHHGKNPHVQFHPETLGLEGQVHRQSPTHDR